MHTVIYGVYIRFWPTLHTIDVLRMVCGEACATDFGVACGRTAPPFNILRMVCSEACATDWPAEG